MKHSWTGGQYSLWRALFAVALAAQGWPRLEWCLPAIALAVGFRDRIAALLLASIAGFQGEWVAAALLLLHATTRGAPYLSLDARGRPEPGGSWILPRWNLFLRRVLALAVLTGVPWPLAVALLLAACDPGWIPPLRAKRPTRVLYDGYCALCHGFVRMLLAEDQDGRAFRFAPLQGSTVSAAMPDSVVVVTPEGETLIRSRGTLHVLARLGGVWRLAGMLAGVFPRFVLDAAYDGIARVRHRVFGRTAEACPIVPPHLAARFER